MLCPVVYAWWIACLPGPLQYTLQRLIHSLSIIYSPILCIILLFNPAFSLELFMSSPAIGAKLVAYLHCIQWQQSNDTNIVAIRLVNVLEKNSLYIFIGGQQNMAKISRWHSYRIWRLLYQIEHFSGKSRSTIRQIYAICITRWQDKQDSNGYTGISKSQ